MAKREQTDETKRAELTFWACFIVILALFSQAMFPSQVMAARVKGETRAILCMDSPGAVPAVDASLEKLIASHDKSNRYQGLKCPDCVTASITALPVPDCFTVPAPFAIEVVTLTVDQASQPVRARAPPRPFSCGPPSRA